MLPAAEKCVRDVTFCLNQIVDTRRPRPCRPASAPPGAPPRGGRRPPTPMRTRTCCTASRGSAGRSSRRGRRRRRGWSTSSSAWRARTSRTHSSGGCSPAASRRPAPAPPPVPDRPLGGPPASARRTSSSSADPRSAPIQSPQNSLEDLMQPGAQSEYMMGFLEKTSDSNRVGPMDSWKWQRRWFVLADAKRNLYYFRDPDELPNFRGCINMEECLVEDLAATQAARNAGVRDPWDFGSPAGQNG